MIKPKFFGKIQGGQFVHEDPELFGNYMAKFDEGKEMELTIGSRYRRRSQGAPGEVTNFNGYYWAVVVRIVADEIGEIDQEVVHYWIQMEVGNFKAMPNGQKIPKGTAEMSGGEFAEFCSRARTWAGTPGNICEKGCFIPGPNEVEY